MPIPKKINAILFVILILQNTFMFAQIKTQTIRGSVIDKVTRQPVIGAAVSVVGTTQGSITNASGNFSISNVGIGRQSVKCTSIGYETFSSEEFILNSAKEVVLTIDLKESIGDLQEVNLKIQ